MISLVLLLRESNYRRLGTETAGVRDGATCSSGLFYAAILVDDPSIFVSCAVSGRITAQQQQPGGRQQQSWT